MSYDPINEPNEPWVQNTYQTGFTSPQKNYKGIIALLLTIVIILCGVITILGVMNVQLFKQVNANQGETLPISIQNVENTEESILSTIPPQTTETTEPALTENTDTVNILPTPTSEANIPQEGGLSLQEIYRKAIPSVVSITCTLQNGESSGTGVILTEEGYIATNCHVVDGAVAVDIQLSDGRIFAADIIGTDAISDLAVLRIAAADLVAAQVGDSSVLQVGDLVVAIGDPLGAELRGTMTDGIVSAINRDVNVDGRVMNLIQTNAALNSGNSGGPLLNCYGQVIGINTMKIGDYMSSAGVEGLGFAIPSNTFIGIINQLIEQGYVSGRPSLGVVGEDVSSFYQFYYGLPAGFYVTGITENGPAEKIGLQPKDIILTIDGNRITGSADLETVLYNYQPGDSLMITIYRNGRQYSGTITVGEAGKKE